jgi:hypothetical protein
MRSSPNLEQVTRKQEKMQKMWKNIQWISSPCANIVCIVPLLFHCPLEAILYFSSQKSNLGGRQHRSICIWCYPTPKQRAILKSSKLVFASPFGSGKTFRLSIEISDKGGKVVFLLFLDAEEMTSKIKPLLAYDLEQKFKKHPNIKVEVAFFEDGRSDNLKDIEAEGINHWIRPKIILDL